MRICLSYTNCRHCFVPACCILLLTVVCGDSLPLRPAALAGAAAAPSSRVRYETQSAARTAAAGWRRIGAADADQRLSLLFALKHTQTQIDELAAAATAISSPGSEQFRRYLSYEELLQRFAPSADAAEIVVQFVQETLGLNENAIFGSPRTDKTTFSASNSTSRTNATIHGDAHITVHPSGWVSVDGITVAEAEHMLHADFSVWARRPKAEQSPMPTDAGLSIVDASASSLPVENESHAPPMPVERDAHATAVDHTSSAPIVRSSSGYSLPADVAAHVDFVGGVTKLPSTHFQARIPKFTRFNVKHRSASDAAVAPLSEADSNTAAEEKHPHTEVMRRRDTSYTVTPELLRSQYNIPEATRGSLSRANRQVVPQFLEQYYNEGDLQAFLHEHSILPPQNVSKVVGPNNADQPGGEASLDVQMIMSMAPGILTELWSFPGRRDNAQPSSPFNQEPFLSWLVHLTSDPDPPLVHSVSYADDEKQCGEAYMRRIDIEFQKAAVRGISIVFAAGDDGIGSVDARTDPAGACQQASPTFPSSSPWVTSVGGTQFGELDPMNPHPANDEVVCSAATGGVVTTGGGFSNIFPRPLYQMTAVESYLSKGASSPASNLLPPASWFNSTNRGYPDVAILATNYEIIVGGVVTRIGGTSASAPVMAAMISLWNEARITKGLAPLGFLNPAIYQLFQQHPEAFNDVTEGNNACSESPTACCPYGFSAAAGWDAASGLGTPNFSVLAQYLTQ